MALPGQLQSLAANMPVANNQIASGLQQARQAQLQQAFRGAGQVSTPQQVQQMAGATARQAGQIGLQQAQKAQQQAQQLGQMQLSEQQRQNKLQLADKARQLQRQRRNAEAQLFNLGREYKQRLLDDQLQFERDQAGRTLFNERQLADWAITQAKSDEDFAAYEQMVAQASQKRMKMLDISLQKIKQALEQGYTETNQKLDFEAKKKLAVAKNNLEEKIRREKAKQANRAAIYSAVGTIAGAGIGTLVAPVGGGAVGAMAGAAVGQGIGQIVAGTSV